MDKIPKSNIVLRVIIGTLIGAVVLSCIILGGIPLMALTLVFITIGVFEYVQILKHKGFFPNISLILVVCWCVILLTAFKLTGLLLLLLTIATIAAFMSVLFKGKQPYTANVATTILGFMYASLPCYIILIRQINYQGSGILSFSLNDGLGYLVLMFFTILMTDIGGYFVGKKFGKHKLAKIISPQKTIEGAVGGATLAVFASLVVSYFIHLPWYHGLIVGLLITFFAQIGDLAESMIKRDAGVKDSGDSIPGHGGFLDRADSYIFTAPIAFYYFQFFVVNNNAVVAQVMPVLRKVLNVFGV